MGNEQHAHSSKLCVWVLVTSDDGQHWAVKQVPGSHASMLPDEAEGLQALSASGTAAVPRVHYVGRGSLVMEALGPAQEENSARPGAS